MDVRAVTECAEARSEVAWTVRRADCQHMRGIADSFIHKSLGDFWQEYNRRIRCPMVSGEQLSTQNLRPNRGFLIPAGCPPTRQFTPCCAKSARRSGPRSAIRCPKSSPELGPQHFPRVRGWCLRRKLRTGSAGPYVAELV